MTVSIEVASLCSAPAEGDGHFNLIALFFVTVPFEATRCTTSDAAEAFDAREALKSLVGIIGEPLDGSLLTLGSSPFPSFRLIRVAAGCSLALFFVTVSFEATRCTSSDAAEAFDAREALKSLVGIIGEPLDGSLLTLGSSPFPSFRLIRVTAGCSLTFANFALFFFVFFVVFFFFVSMSP